MRGDSISIMGANYWLLYWHWIYLHYIVLYIFAENTKSMQEQT